MTAHALKTGFATLLLLGCTQASDLFAQEMSFALFGGAGVGVGAHDNGSFSDRLSSWSPIGGEGRELVYRTERISGTGLSVTGALGLMPGPDWYIGISGERVFFPSTTAITSADEVGEYDLSAGGGQAEFGYVVVNDDATLVTPVLGVGLYGYGLSFENGTRDSIPLYEGDPIPPGGSSSYAGSAPRIALGVLLHRFMGGASEDRADISAPVLSFRLMWTRFLSHPEWERNGSVVNNGGHTPCYHSLSLSVTVGGGIGSL